MIGDGRPGGNHMFDVIIVFQVRGDGGGNDATLRMSLINATGSLDLMPACFHGFLHHSRTVRFHALLAVRTHEFDVLRPPKWRIVLAVCAWNGDEP